MCITDGEACNRLAYQQGPPGQLKERTRVSTSPHGRPQTIADVAARAGVSLATVSRVMNGNPSVDEALAEKVRAAAEELNYSASPLARSLVLGKTNTIAVVVPDLSNPTFHGVLRGLSRAAGRDGYHILIADSAESVAEERPRRRDAKALRRHRVVRAAHGRGGSPPPAPSTETSCAGEP